VPLTPLPVPPQLLSVLQLLQALDGDAVVQYPELGEVVTMDVAYGQHWLFESQVNFITMPLLDEDPTEVTLVALGSLVHEQDNDGQ